MSKAVEADVDEIVEETVPTHWRAMISPKRWAKATFDTSDDYFHHRVGNMSSEEHLRTLLELEVARDDVRNERVGRINQRISEVRE